MDMDEFAAPRARLGLAALVLGSRAGGAKLRPALIAAARAVESDDDAAKSAEHRRRRRGHLHFADALRHCRGRPSTANEKAGCGTRWSWTRLLYCRGFCLVAHDILYFFDRKFVTRNAREKHEPN